MHYFSQRCVALHFDREFTMKHLIKRLTVAVGIAASALTAQADPTIVTNWSYSLGSLFSAAAPGAVNGVGTDTLSWGTGVSGPSSLVIGNNNIVNAPATTFIGAPGLIPPAFWAAGNSITHNNNPITGTSLSSATLTASLSLAALLPVATPGLPGALPPLNVNIGFVETANSGTCTVVTSPTPCNDIFVLVGGLLNQVFSYDVDGSGAVNYFLNVFPSTGGILSQLTVAECAAAGQAAGCIGFTTPENQSTTLGFSFTISTQPFTVPEPGSLALVALGMIGVAALMRRRKLQA